MRWQDSDKTMRLGWVAGLLSATVLVATVWPMTGCGGGNDVVGSEIAASFTASGTDSTPGLVRLRGGSTAGDRVTVEVAIGGPTATTDLYSFAFDLVLSDPTVAQYVNGTAVFGSALTIGTGQDRAVLVSQSGGRVVVGVSKTGGGPGSGNGVAVTEAVIVSLNFQVLKRGTTRVTFGGSPNPAALDSTGAVIGSVGFDGFGDPSVFATISGN